MKYLPYSLFLFICSFSFQPSDAEVKISFLPLYEGLTISLQEEGQVINDSLQLETFKCYLSQVTLYNDDQIVFAEKDSYHLLDAADSASLHWRLPVPKGLYFTHLQFNIGIDSLINSSGAFGGDLDPTKGMYWTWQSGFINFKLEGVASNCPARHHRFQLHIGGYQSRFNTLQQVRLEVGAKKDIYVNVLLGNLFSQIDWRTQYQIMSPNEEAVAVAKLLPSMFAIER